MLRSALKPGSLSAVAGGGADDVETTDGRDRRKAREGPVTQHATRNNTQHAACNTRSAPTQARDVAAAAPRVAAADCCRTTALSILSMLRRRRLHVAPHLARSMQPPVGARSELGRSLAEACSDAARLSAWGVPSAARRSSATCNGRRRRTCAVRRRRYTVQRHRPGTATPRHCGRATAAYFKSSVHCKGSVPF